MITITTPISATESIALIDGELPMPVNAQHWEGVVRFPLAMRDNAAVAIKASMQSFVTGDYEGRCWIQAVEQTDPSTISVTVKGIGRLVPKVTA